MQMLDDRIRQERLLAEKQLENKQPNNLLQKQEPTISILDTSMLDSKEITRNPAENFVYRVE
jgi:hypothetical protein